MPVAVLSRSSASGRSSRVAAPKPRKEVTDPALIALHGSIPPIFQQAQHSLATHRKNVVSLYRIHQKVAAITEHASDGRVRPIGEKAFNEVFVGCLDRVLPIKKGVPNADRVCKFVAAYVAYAQEQFRLQARADKAEDGEDGDDDEEEEDTTATRFASLLLKHLLKGSVAKNKNVRYRCCGCIALFINGLEDIEENLFLTLKSFMLERARDKESIVRVQAVIALTKLQTNEDDDDEESEEIKQALIETLRFDPSHEVRRAALNNLTANKESTPLLLERLRDVDPINRRCVYLGSFAGILKTQMQALQGPGAAQAGPSRLGLDIDSAGEVIRVGMGEREPSVKRAAQKLVNAWFDACGGDLVVFLNQFDVVGSKHIETALLTIFESRPALVAQVTFDADEFWANLSPSTAFLARVFIDHFKRTKNDRRLEECLPVVTALAFRIQKEYSELTQLLQQYNAIANSALIPEDEAEIALFTIRNKTFVVSQLLGIGLASDYGDEAGRNKMFGLVREMISDIELPEDLVPACLDVLLKLTTQKDFMRIIVEIVLDLGDEDDADADDLDETEIDDTMSVDGSQLARKKSRKSIRSKETSSPAHDALAIEHRCLTIVRAMLERVVGALQENTAFHGLIPQLIAPAVRSKETPVRELGLMCLALCCLLDRKLALDSFPLFIDQVQRADGPIKLRAVQAVFDLLINHTIPYLCSRNPAGEEMARRQIISYLLSLLEDEDPTIQSAACEGMAKLMLTGMVDDDEALKSLVLIYMSPETMANQELRQCLSYFLPVYCGSSSRNQRHLQRVFLSVLQVLTEVYEEKDEDQEMVTPTQVGLQLLDWTDPDKVMMRPGQVRDENVHVDVAIELIKAMYTIEDTKDCKDRKVMCQLLGKVFLPEELDDAKVQEVLILLTGLHELNDITDTVTKNALGRFEAAFAKAYTAQVEAGLDGLDLESTPAFDSVKAFFDAIQVDVEEVIQAYAHSPIKVASKTSRKSTSKGVSSARSSEAASSKKSKKRRDDSDEEEEDEDEDNEEEEEEDDE
ncbi:Nuclear condensin complex subunit 3, C-terminal domain protein [Kalmanozyma brasiliensis GHG001]|uniref:Putative nuclear condensin complex subunit G n=1 Tax=Kalmanozyma brasiliensis (strain GHG001) TaxID=1365824 RepID=V5EHK2_KALBG|nr:Nuclear condensin complex subunit 3, C-terminal domain protein [Kalmanozyma brasiliensis GHG001]EST10071.1 Nuclear condensin complex subunit 3, C-terminal domain protein [Kalmanozyma brasiliensis GHG001]